MLDLGVVKLVISGLQIVDVQFKLGHAETLIRLRREEIVRPVVNIKTFFEGIFRNLRSDSSSKMQGRTDLFSSSLVILAASSVIFFSFSSSIRIDSISASSSSSVLSMDLK